MERSIRPEIKLDKLNELVQNVVMETQRIQSEFDYHKKIRNTYFHLFKEVQLPSESYSRIWQFKKDNSRNENENQKRDASSGYSD